MQISATSANGAWHYLTNAGAARVRGGEIELGAQIGSRLSIGANGALIDARLIADQSTATSLPTSITGLQGDRIPFVPRYTAGASTSYAVPLTRRAKLEGRLDYARTGPSASEFRPASPTYERQPSHGQLSGRISLTAGKMRLLMSVTNILNSANLVRVVSNVNGIEEQATSTSPRFFLFSIRTSL